MGITGQASLCPRQVAYIAGANSVVAEYRSFLTTRLEEIHGWT